jgi:glycine cleavage system aminomethyltransferase T
MMALELRIRKLLIAAVAASSLSMTVQCNIALAELDKSQPQNAKVDKSLIAKVSKRAHSKACNPHYCREDKDCTTGSECGTCWASLCGPAP